MRILIGLALAGVAIADLAFPSLGVDHIAVSATAPQIGAEVLAIPGSTWLVAFDDDWQLADPDYNDAVAIMEFDGRSSARLTFIAAVSSYRGVMRMAFHGGEPFIELHQSAHYRTQNDGHAVTLELLTANGNATYFAGGPILNPDSRRHAFVSRLR